METLPGPYLETTGDCKRPRPACGSASAKFGNCSQKWKLGRQIGEKKKENPTKTNKKHTEHKGDVSVMASQNEWRCLQVKWLDFPGRCVFIDVELFVGLYRHSVRRR